MTTITCGSPACWSECEVKRMLDETRQCLALVTFLVRNDPNAANQDTVQQINDMLDRGREVLDKKCEILSKP